MVSHISWSWCGQRWDFCTTHSPCRPLSFARPGVGAACSGQFDGALGRRSSRCACWAVLGCWIDGLAGPPHGVEAGTFQPNFCIGKEACAFSLFGTLPTAVGNNSFFGDVTLGGADYCARGYLYNCSYLKSHEI